MTKSNGWNFLTLILTLVYFLQWENGFAVKAGPVELYQDDQYNAIPSASYSNLQADLQPQVMDTGVEFLVDIDKVRKRHYSLKFIRSVFHSINYFLSANKKERKPKM
jgi:hypothetical protein